MVDTLDTAVVEPEAPQYNARLVSRIDETESLASFFVRFDGDPTRFEPGQYMTIGIVASIGGAPARMVQRPYSVASDPAVARTDGYEMYVRLVQGGQFTPYLWQLPIGHRMRMIGPKGKFTLNADDDRIHVFISSGTGNAPFVSMMRAMLREGRTRRVVFLNGVSYVRDLGYRSLVEGWQASGEFPVTYIPTVSRPQSPENEGWTGRWGRVETIVNDVYDDLRLTPDNSIAYICGNPDMITAADEVLLGRGFPEEQVRKELYWPKGKTAAGAGEAAEAADAE